jgi:hypothetical protein
MPIVGNTTGTTVVSIPNYGITEITGATTNTWTLDRPNPGVRKILYSLSTAANARIVQLSTDAAAAVKVGNQLATRITFNATVAQVIELLGINSTQWVVISASPETAAVNSTGIVIATS